MTVDFGVVPDQLRNVAGVLRGSAEDLRAVRSAWDRQTVDGSAMFGTTECADAFRALQETWFQDLGRRIGYLTDLGDAAEDSANTYARVDDTARQDFGRRDLG
ncbi:MAG: WXG100 family type VII secretion target [Pseudonocardiaceae bacterium]